MNVKWSKEEIAVLKKYYPLYPTKITREDLEKLFPCRTWAAIMNKAGVMGFSLYEGSINREFLAELQKTIKV